MSTLFATLGSTSGPKKTSSPKLAAASAPGFSTSSGGSALFDEVSDATSSFTVAAAGNTTPLC